MTDKLPLSSIIEVAFQRAKCQEHIDYLNQLSAQIATLENCYKLESAAR